ncbi:acyl carrier protein [Paenibacillus sp. ACRRX]|nr:acyl carrier protein [Paenibacillus sp. ACRRX]MCG7409129.1 acyl carrier protein [Paenibacillus sp. ACRRX]
MLAQRLRQELTSSLAEALYLSAADIDTDKPFIEMGLDSIIGVEWMRTINRCYGTTIAATKVYDYPNVRDLASYLANQLHQAEAGTLSNQTTAEHKTISETRSISSSVAGISIPDISTGSRQMGSLLQELTETLAEALYLTIDKVDTEVKFIDLGLDSIVGVEWLRAVNRQYGTTVTATKLYDYPTLREFATYLNSQLSDYDGSQPSVDHVLQQVQAGKLDIQQAEKLLMTLGGV